VILSPCRHAWLTKSNPPSVFLPLAIKGSFAAFALGVAWLVCIRFDRGKGLQRNKPSSKGATP
jgi:hypothetical protein